MSRQPKFQIAFKQSRRYSRPDFSTTFDEVAQRTYFDIDVQYTSGRMVAGPYSDLTSKRRQGRTAMFATVDELTGIINLEIRNWNPLLRASTSKGYGLLDLWAQMKGNKINMGHCTSLEEAREKLQAFDNECTQKGLSPIRTPSWLPGNFWGAERLYDVNAEREEARKKAEPATLLKTGTLTV